VVTRSRRARPVRRVLAIAAVATVLAALPALGTVGLAEWETATPGGHQISHVDPLKERFGTCLRNPGAIRDDPAGIYVDHLEWWAFYPDHVAGKARGGYFVFDERSRRVDFYSTERDLSRRIAALGLGPPTSKRLTPEDGWREAWLPVYRESCRRLDAGGSAPGVDAATYQKMKEICAGLGIK
jgi:hypothetical protein